MKTIIHIVYSHKAFDDRVFFKEAISLSKRYRTIILSGTKDGKLLDMGGKVHESGFYSGVEVYGFKVEVSKDIYNKILRKLRRKLNLAKRQDYSSLYKKIEELNLKPDIIHIHEPSILSAIPYLKYNYSCKVIFDCHEYHYAYFQEHNFSSDKNLKLVAEELKKFRYNFNNCDGVINVTKTMEAINWFIKPSIKHITIQNSTLINKVSNNKNPSFPIWLVHEGAMSFSRGLKLMIEMFEDSWFKDNIRLKIVGELSGKEAEYYLEKVSKFPYLKDCIKITGWIDYEELQENISGDIGLIFFEKFPNNYLGMPNKLFNYIGSGIPVLTVELLEVGRVMDSFGCGLMVNRNLLSIKNGINEIIQNYSSFIEGVERARKPLSWEHDEKKLLKFYDDLMGDSQ
jgi:glycosyltransferase involved in cell wall biosynthesis